jgi:type I restriction enzyme S subunit
MPNNWKTYKLGDIAQLKKEAIKPIDFNGEDYIGLEHIGQGDFLLNGIGKASDAKSNKLKFIEGDILYGKIRPYFKKVYRPKFSGICSTDILIINSKNKNLVSQSYLHQFIKSQQFTDKATETSTGTKMPRADWNSLGLWEILFPPLPEQKAIANILSAIDDKIENNLAINKTLEEMVMALYKHWFIDFGPFQNGEFVDSELGKIPKGWEVKRLDDVTTMFAGGDKPKAFSKVQTEDLKIPIYSNGISNEGLYGFTDKARVNDESVTVSARGTIGYVSLRMQPFLPIVRLVTLIPNKEYISNKYLFLCLKKQNIQGNGTTQQQLTVPDFKETKVIVPKLKIIKQFTVTIDSFYDNIISNKEENQSLTKLRGTLLPKLISGEIRLKAFQKEVKEYM